MSNGMEMKVSILQCIGILVGKLITLFSGRVGIAQFVEHQSCHTLAAERSAGVTPEVNLRNSWCACEGIHPGLETQCRHH